MNQSHAHLPRTLVCVSHSLVSDSLQPHGLLTRPLCPWNSPGKNPGADCHSLLQRSFPTQGLNTGLLHRRQTLYRLSYREVSHPCEEENQVLNTSSRNVQAPPPASPPWTWVKPERSDGLTGALAACPVRRLPAGGPQQKLKTEVEGEGPGKSKRGCLVKDGQAPKGVS